MLRKIDESFLESLSDEERSFFSEWADTFETMDVLARGTARATVKVCFRAILIGVSNALIDSYVSDEYFYVAKILRDKALNPSGRDMKFETVKLRNGKEIRLPDLTTLPETEMFQTIDEIVEAIADPMSELPPSFRKIT